VAREVYAALAVCGFLLLAVWLVFGQTINYEFVNFDDNAYVYENPRIAHGLTAKGIDWAFTTAYGSLWAPLTWSSYLLDFQLYGLKPGGYHFTSILLHIATTILLFLVFWRMTGDLWPSALVAAMFAIHPQNVESVTWVAERKGLLSGLFFMLTIGAYLGCVRHRFSMVRYLAVVLLFALGLMAKPMLVTLPFVLLLLDYWPLGRVETKPRPLVAPSDTRWGGSCNATPDATVQLSLQQSGLSKGASAGRSLMMNAWFLVLEKIPLLAMAALSCVVAVWAQGQALAPNELLSPYWRMGNSLISYVVYLGRVFYPAGLAIPYPRRALDLPIWTVLGAFLVLVGITAAALVGRRKRPYLLVGWLWYLGMLVPVIGLIQFGIQAMADRFTYLPRIGLCIALAWGASQVVASWPNRRWLCGAGSALVLAILMACAWRQTAFWRDSVALWNHTLACTSQNSVALRLLGDALKNQGRLDEALAKYQKALEIRPNSAEAHNNLGEVLARIGRPNEAVAEYRKALEIRPDLAEAHNNLGNALLDRGRLDEAIAEYRKALESQADYAEMHYNLGYALAKSGRLNEGIIEYRKALEINPDYAQAHNNLGNALVGCGRVNEAITHYRKALEIRRDYAQAHCNLAMTLSRQGKIPEALAEWREALRIRPSDVTLLNDTAWVLATCPDASVRNGAEAVELARQALRLSDGREPIILDTLAAAYAEAGRFPEAVQTARKALNLAAQLKQRELVESIRAKIPLYEAGTPFRETRHSAAHRSLQPEPRE
jgi:tetratricopeptide (TPR) repeat protein